MTYRVATIHPSQTDRQTHRRTMTTMPIARLLFKCGWLNMLKIT